MRGLRAIAEEYRTAAVGGLRQALHKASVGIALRGEALARENATAFPRVRTGHLRRSIAGVAELDSTGPRITLTAGKGATEVYASAIEYGATIRPRRGRFLAIPVGAALTSSGVPRYPGPRAVPNLHFVPTARGGLLVRDGKGRTDILYVLVRRTVIAPRRFIGRALDTLRPEARVRLGDALRRALGGA